MDFFPFFSKSSNNPQPGIPTIVIEHTLISFALIFLGPQRLPVAGLAGEGTCHHLSSPLRDSGWSDPAIQRDPRQTTSGERHGHLRPLDNLVDHCCIGTVLMQNATARPTACWLGVAEQGSKGFLSISAKSSNQCISLNKASIRFKFTRHETNDALQVTAGLVLVPGASERRRYA